MNNFQGYKVLVKSDRYTDLVVSTSDDDQYFIVERPNIERSEDSDDQLHIFIDTTDSTALSEIPDFSFLGLLHEKLKQISCLTMRDHIKKCQ